MSVLRFFAIVIIFGAVSIAWMILGGSVWVRTEMLDSSLSQEMERLWGPKTVVQTAPYLSASPDGSRAGSSAGGPSSSTINTDIRHEHRYKGLLWYSTFTVAFDGAYTIEPAGGEERGEYFIFRLPEGITLHDGLAVAVDGADVPLTRAQKTSGTIAMKVDRAARHVVNVRFTTYGRDVWLYAPGDADEISLRGHRGAEVSIPAGKVMSELKDFSLTVNTSFSEIDYPRGTRSPEARARPNNGGMTAVWAYKGLITRQSMGIVMPKRPNAGPIAARMSFFAPVSLLFFFTALFTVVVLKKIPLHPMHYMFIAAGFFAFHILLAYLADLIDVQVAFWICAGVSVFLVVSYMRLVAGMKFAATYVAAAQLAYLVGFSYAFFWVGKTGLTVTIGAIVTLLVLMQATGRVDWHEVFRLSSRKRAEGPGQAAAPTAIPPAPDAVDPPPGPPPVPPQS